MFWGGYIIINSNSNNFIVKLLDVVAAAAAAVDELSEPEWNMRQDDLVQKHRGESAANLFFSNMSLTDNAQFSK